MAPEDTSSIPIQAPRGVVSDDSRPGIIRMDNKLSLVLSIWTTRNLEPVPTRKSPQERRAEILAATQRLVAQRGFASVALRDVAAEVGVSTGCCATTSRPAKRWSLPPSRPRSRTRWTAARPLPALRTSSRRWPAGSSSSHGALHGLDRRLVRSAAQPRSGSGPPAAHRRMHRSSRGDHPPRGRRRRRGQRRPGRRCAPAHGSLRRLRVQPLRSATINAQSAGDRYGRQNLDSGLHLGPSTSLGTEPAVLTGRRDRSVGQLVDVRGENGQQRSGRERSGRTVPCSASPSTRAG